MFTLLLAIIYLAFISLGLPDSILGSTWPTMQAQMGVPLSYAGGISMIIAGGTIVSSLLSDKLTRKFGTGLITAISVLMTAVALFGFSFSASFWMLCLWAVPYGLGAGAVDAALNNYVAVHYSARHMSWLHCFWGVGAAASPYIMNYCLTNGFGWPSGYKTIAVIQVALTAVLFASLPLWKNQGTASTAENKTAPTLSLSRIFKIKGVRYMLLAFFSYSALESTIGLWASSFLVIQRGMNAETAAKYASFFYLGITFGRFICGFVSDKVGDRNMIRVGILILFMGIFAVFLPTSQSIFCLIGLILAGVGCAPIYPSIIHSTPSNFGAENSQAIVGVQMASAYTGSTFMPPLFGILASNITIGLYPLFALFFAVLMLITTERLNKTVLLPSSQKQF